MDLTFILNWPLLVMALLVAGVSSLLALAGLLVVRRYPGPQVLQHNNEVAGFVYAVVGVIYAVVLAFVFIVVWEQWSNTEEVLEKEASALASLYREIQVFPPAQQMPLREHIYLYTKRVIDDEWKEMTNGGSSQKARDQYNAIWQSLRDLKLETPIESQWYPELLSRLNDLAENRRIRLTRSELHTPAIFWPLMIVGGIITIAYTYLYGVKSVRAQSLMTVSLTVIISLILLSIFAMQHPFSGSMQLHPVPFDREIQSYERQMRAEGIPFPEAAAPAAPSH